MSVATTRNAAMPNETQSQRGESGMIRVLLLPSIGDRVSIQIANGPEYLFTFTGAPTADPGLVERGTTVQTAANNLAQKIRARLGGQMVASALDAFTGAVALRMRSVGNLTLDIPIGAGRLSAQSHNDGLIATSMRYYRHVITTGDMTNGKVVILTDLRRIDFATALQAERANGSAELLSARGGHDVGLTLAQLATFGGRLPVQWSAAIGESAGQDDGANVDVAYVIVTIDAAYGVAAGQALDLLMLGSLR